VLRLINGLLRFTQEAAPELDLVSGLPDEIVADPDAECACARPLGAGFVRQINRRSFGIRNTHPRFSTSVPDVIAAGQVSDDSVNLGKKVPSGAAPPCLPHADRETTQIVSNEASTVPPHGR
jgi:hypothetical protein